MSVGEEEPIRKKFGNIKKLELNDSRNSNVRKRMQSEPSCSNQ